MKKEEVSKDLKELKAKLQEKEAVIGADLVLKRLKDKSLSKVFLASNAPQKIREDVQYYAKLAGIIVSELSLDNEELGLFCKKNFFIAVIGTK